MKIEFEKIEKARQLFNILEMKTLSKAENLIKLLCMQEILKNISIKSK